MKIAFDASPLYNQKTGVGYYTFNLIKTMQEENPCDEFLLVSKFSYYRPYKVAYRLALNKMCLRDEKLYKYYFSRIPLVGHYHIWRYLGISLFDLFHDLNADIYHGVNFLPLPTNRGKSVVTIHDLYFLINPSHIAKKTKFVFTREIKFAAHKADFIITVSESTKKDVINMLNVSPQKVKAIPLAAGPQFTCFDDDNLNQETRNRYTHGYPFILYLGTLEPRKNLVRLVQAFALVKRKGIPHKLVLAGRKGWLYEDIFETIAGLNMEKEIITPDYVSEEDVPRFYNAAELFVFPSLYEGFGLPVLEAMACGTPVITTNISSLPEVVGEAGILIHPQDTEGLAKAIERVLNDADLRKTLRTKGLQQVKKFSWQKTAKETLDVYRSLV